VTTMLHVLQRALGRDGYGQRPRGRADDYRNHYVAGEGHHSWDALREAVANGLMREHQPREVSGGDPIFTVTDAGKVYIAEHSPKPPKISRSKARYLAYLSSAAADCDVSFGDWLKSKLYERRADVL